MTPIIGRLSVAALLLAAALAAHAQPATEAIVASVAHLRSELGKLPESVMQAADREALNSQLTVAEDAAKAGHAPMALHRLNRVWRVAVAQTMRVATEPQHKDGLPALERYWKEAGVERERRLAKAAREGNRGRSAAARALAEAAMYESRIVYDGALTYGGQVGVMAGYFYLGESQGLLDFALFCGTLPGSGKPAPKIGSLDAQIAALEIDVLEEYGRDTASSHRDFFARANGSLKLARELNQGGELSGALYELLLAHHAMGQFRATVAPQDQASIEKAASAMVRRVDTAKTDSGIAAIFLELGNLELKSAQTATDLKRHLINAQAMFTTVLTAYFKAVGE